MATSEKEKDETGKSMLELVRSGEQAWDKIDDLLENPVTKNMEASKVPQVSSQKEDQENGDGSNSATKIKIKSLNSLVEDNLPPSSNMSDFTIGDIVEHGDFVSSDESGVMHLKITNVMSVDESITGCTVSEDDKDVFANIQIASVTTLMDDDPSSPVVSKEKSSTQPSTTSTTTTIATSTATTSTGLRTIAPAPSTLPATLPAAERVASTATSSSVPALKIVNLHSLTQHNGSTASDTTMCMVPQSAAAAVVATEGSSSSSSSVAGKSMHYIIRSSLVVPRSCIICSKSTVCQYRVVATKNDECTPSDGCSLYLCSESCRGAWQKRLPGNIALEKPRKYFERVCGMCGNDINETNKGRFSWETREFCNKLCLADHIGYVGQRCRQCQSTVRLLHMGKYCVRFGSDIYQFCSNTCLESYKVNIQVCCYCQKNLGGITPKELRDVITLPGNKKYCSSKCHRRALRKDINQQFYSDKKSCTVCTGMVVPRFEFLKDDETSYLCSQPCLNVYKFANSYKAVNCCLCLRLLCVESVLHFLYHNNGQLRVFCSTSCTNVFILSTRRIVTCCFCKVKKYNFDMIQLHDDTAASFYCSVCCLNLHKQKDDVSEDFPAVTAPALAGSAMVAPPPSLPPLPPPSFTTPLPAAAKPPPKPPASQPPAAAQLTQCNLCGNMSPAQFHMVMSDNTLRNFCSYPCASRYKVTYGFLVSNKPNTGPPQTKPPPPLPAPPPAPQPPQQIEPPRSSESTASSLRAFRAPRVLTGATTTRCATPPLPPPPTLPSLPSTKTDTECLIERIKEAMTPKVMVNKSVMCKPVRTAESVAEELIKNSAGGAKHKSVTVTGEDGKERIFVPVPIPVFVPAPMAMYSLPTPVPILLPVPIPVPVVIPTSAQNMEAVWKTIEDLRAKYGGDGKKGGVEVTEAADGAQSAEAMEEDTNTLKTLSTEECKASDQSKTATDKVALTASSSAEEGVGSKESGMHQETTVEKPNITEESTEPGKKSSEPSPVKETKDDKLETATDSSGQGEEKKKQPDESDLQGSDVDSTDSSLLSRIDKELPRFHLRLPDEAGGSKRPREEDAGAVEETSTSKRLRTASDSGNRIQTEPGLLAWRAWVSNHNTGLQSDDSALLPDDIASLRSSELSAALALFVKDARKPCGGLYQPDTLYYLLLGLQQHLFQSGKHYCIFLDYVFKKFNIELDSIIGPLAEKLSSCSPSGPTPSTVIVEEDMWQCRLLGTHTPHVLLNTLFYFNTKLFRCKTVQQHASLTLALIHKEWRTVDDQRSAVLRFCPDPNADGEKRYYEMHENKDDPLRCPVKLYEFYLSKCPGNSSTSSHYYVYPSNSCLPDSAVWYSDRELTHHSLELMLHRALLVRELQEALAQPH